MRKEKRMGRLLAVLKKFGWRRWLLLGVNLLLLAAMGMSLAGLGRMRSTPSTLSAAQRFQGEGETRFAQLACYLPVDQGKTEEDIFTFRQALESKLVEQSLEAPENGSLTIDAYCGFADVTVSSENTTGSSVRATGVGGDFFYFHPLTLLGGSYIRSDDLMDDLVVLDEETAWRLFGGTDLAGLTMYINGEPFVVSGVVSRETDFATQKAYTGDGGVYLSYSALSRLVETASITCYETVMPDPISGYALGVVKETFPIGDGDVVENSSRYDFSHLLEVAKSFAERSMRRSGVIYPYWENAVRLTEGYAALLAALSIVFAAFPALTALTLGIRQIRRAYRFVKAKVPEKVEERVEKRREERLERQYEKTSGGE